jgi:serine/threonine-protein kinase HipA
MSTLKVFLSGVECGVVTQTRQGNLQFEYLDSYGTNQTPISIAMPPKAGSYPKSAILPFLEGLLPDSESALRALAARYSVSARNPFALLSHVGADVAGALQFFGPDQRPEPMPSTLVDDKEIANLLQQRIGEYSTGVPGPTAGLFSLAGAQAKLALRKTNNGWETGGSYEPTTHILKPMPQELPDLDLVELLTMETARQIGLDVAQAQFVSFGSLRTLLVTRYDRKEVSGEITRLHQEDFLQAMAVSPKNKYQKLDGGPGIKRIGQMLRNLSTQDRARVAAKFFEGFAFNVLVRATDAHAKNYSLLLDGRKVSMAPLYDLISAAPFGYGTESAMSVSGEYRFDSITDSMLASEGNRLGVPDSDQVVVGLRSELPEAIRAAEKLVAQQLPKALRSRLGDIAKAMLRLF